jgi:uncharacterized membrane protein YhaH (DUF805 family)
MLSLALALVQDSSAQQEQINNAAAGIGVAAMLFIVVLGLAFFAFFIFCYWRIFSKAGMNGALSLLMFIPGIGPIIMICVLAFGEWMVVPVAQTTTLPPPYYPPPSYPPAPTSFPPSQGPTA